MANEILVVVGLGLIFGVAIPGMWYLSKVKRRQREAEGSG